MGTIIVGLAQASSDAQQFPNARPLGRVVGFLVIAYMVYRFFKSRRK